MGPKKSIQEIGGQGGSGVSETRTIRNQVKCIGELNSKCKCDGSFCGVGMAFQVTNEEGEKALATLSGRSAVEGREMAIT